MADTYTLQQFYTCTFESDDSDSSYDRRNEDDFNEEEWVWKDVKEELSDIKWSAPEFTAGISLTEPEREAMYAAEDDVLSISSTPHQAYPI